MCVSMCGVYVYVYCVWYVWCVYVWFVCVCVSVWGGNDSHPFLPKFPKEEKNELVQDMRCLLSRY